MPNTNLTGNAFIQSLVQNLGTRLNTVYGAKITELEEDNQDLKNNQLTNTETGTNIDLTDSADMRIQDIEVSGTTEQDTTKIIYKCAGDETGTYYLTYNNVNYQFTMPTIESGDILIFDTVNLTLKLGNTAITTETGTSGTQLTFSSTPSPDYPQTINNCSGSINIIATNSDNTKSQTITFPLQENQKLMQGDYLADDGIHHVRKQIVLDGGSTESWAYIAANENYARPYIIIANKKVGENNSIANIKADKFKDISWDNGYTATYKDYGVFSYYGDGRIAFLIPKSDLNSLDFTGVKEYFQNNPTKVEYNLENEEIEAYTEAQQEAYNQIKKLRTYKGVTHIYTDDDTQANLSVKYNKDLEIAFNNLQALIVE